MTDLPAKYCGAKKRQGEGYCRRPAGAGTDHKGQGRCKLHGGVVGKQLKHGRYSTVLNDDLRELVERMESDPTPLDVTPELALARGILHGWVDKYRDLMDALLAWNEEEATRENPRPARLPDLRDLYPLLDGISKAVKRIQDARAADAISRKDFLRVLTEMGNVVNQHVDDPEVRERIKHDWARMKLA